MSVRIAAIGECMIELARAGDNLWRQGFAGDTNNTATYLARLLRDHGGSVDYVTALGDDPFSDAMIAQWQSEGIRTDAVQRLPGHLPGLYAIQTRSDGERQFFYWREQAAARRLMDQPDAVATAIVAADTVYLSGITLAILGDAGRRALLPMLQGARNLVFDPNYRPRLWPDPARAREVFARLYALSTIALPTFEDEAMLHGDADPEATIDRLRAAGVGEIVVKRGAEPALVWSADRLEAVPAIAVADAIDTTGAGDSFNAGYLAARSLGRAPAAAAAIGHRLAAEVVRHQGAIIPKAAMPELGLTA